MTQDSPEHPLPGPVRARSKPEGDLLSHASTFRSTWTERATVLAGVTLATVCTAFSACAGIGMDFVGILWLAAIAWTVLSSLALALLRMVRDGDRSAFRRRRLPDGRDERIDAATQSGQYAHLAVADEHERLMRD